MLPIRITFAGCSTSSVMWRSPSPSSSPSPAACVIAGSALAGMVPMGWPSGPTTTTWSSTCPLAAGAAGGLGLLLVGHAPNPRRARWLSWVSGE